MSGFIAKHNGNLLHSTEDLVKKKGKTMFKSQDDMGAETKARNRTEWRLKSCVDLHLERSEYR